VVVLELTQAYSMMKNFTVEKLNKAVKYKAEIDKIVREEKEPLEVRMKMATLRDTFEKEYNYLFS
jgi:hypothetical protein